MTDAEQRLYEAHRDAEEARVLVENKMLARCFASIREEAVREIAESAPEQSADRERAYLMMRAVTLLEAKIAGMAAGGEFAARSLRGRLV